MDTRICMQKYGIIKQQNVFLYVGISAYNHLSTGILIITAPFPQLLDPFCTKSQKASPGIGVKKTNNLEMYGILWS